MYRNRCDWLAFFYLCFCKLIPTKRNARMFNSIFKALRSSAIVNPMSVIRKSFSSQNRGSNISLLTTINVDWWTLQLQKGRERYPSILYMWRVFIKWIQIDWAFNDDLLWQNSLIGSNIQTVLGYLFFKYFRYWLVHLIFCRPGWYCSQRKVNIINPAYQHSRH